MEYEKSIQALEAILSRLEKGNQSLEEALADYEQGLKLARACARQLEEASGRVEKLTQEGRKPLDEDGNEQE